jgi:hypothetical protein
MIVNYDVFCLNRTLTLTFRDTVKRTPEEITKYLDVLYDKWHHTEDIADPQLRANLEATPLEEYLVFGITLFCKQPPVEWVSTDNE